MQARLQQTQSSGALPLTWVGLNLPSSRVWGSQRRTSCISATQPLPLPAGGGPSQECLVTLVMKVDLGGWLSQRSLIRRLGAPLSEALMRAWLEPMLLSVVMLRDKASQLT